jgi:hypothetical protein
MKNRFQSLPFKFNLQRYAAGVQECTKVLAVGELYKSSNPVLTHSLKGAWFQPLNLRSE